MDSVYAGTTLFLASNVAKTDQNGLSTVRTYQSIYLG